MEASSPPELSVVIPCRNVGDTLGAQLESLARQETTGSWQVLVVDNGSTDDTVSVARSYGDRLRLRVVPCEAPGLSAARNAGARAAESEAIAFVDGDDIVGEGWVEAMTQALRVHDYVTGPLELDLLNPPQLAVSRGREGAAGLPRFAGTFAYARGGNMGIRRSVLARVGWFDEQTPALEDQELGLRMLVAGIKVTLISGAVVHYRYRTDAASIWRQGLFYGRARVPLFLAARRAGVPTPSRLAGWRSWAWLLLHLPMARTAAGRLTLLWVLGGRLGQVLGSIRWRTVFL